MKRPPAPQPDVWEPVRIRWHGNVAFTTAVVLLLFAALPCWRASAADDATLACRRGVGREATRLLRKGAQVLRNCEDRRLRGVTTTCPEATTDEAKLTRARERTRSGIIRACGGGPPPEFATGCPEPCPARVDDAQSLAGCIVCLTDAMLTSFTSLMFPALPDPPAVCGDGQIGAGEQCDPPDEAACPDRCGPQGAPDACQCQPVQSCTELSQPPASCTTDDGCPPGYTCTSGQCAAGACEVKADCASDGECVHVGSAAEGTCICRGCAPWICPRGCTVGGIVSGCLCASLDDCPPEDDVCFQGVCS